MTVKKRFKEIRTFQRNSRIEINNPEELTTFIKQIRTLVFDADIPVTSAYLLVIDPENIVTKLSDQTEVVESVSRFKLLNLRS